MTSALDQLAYVKEGFLLCNPTHPSHRGGCCSERAPTVYELLRSFLECVPACRYVRFGYYVEAVDLFDAGAFRLAASEASAVDPQTRICLEQTQASICFHPMH